MGRYEQPSTVPESSIKDGRWTPIAYPLSEAEAYIYSGKLNSQAISSVVYHNCIWTGVYGLNYFDEHPVMVPRSQYDQALQVLDLAKPWTAGRRQLLGARYATWIGLALYNGSPEAIVVAVVVVTCWLLRKIVAFVCRRS